MDAFVYLRVRPGTLEDVVVRLENVGGVRAAVAVVGAWDVLAAVRGPTSSASRRTSSAASIGSTASSAR